MAACAFSGLRLGEAAAFQVGDVDFLRRRIRVSRRVQRGLDRSADIRPPKHGSERTVVAPDRLLTMLGAHVSTYLPDEDRDRWIFPTPTGAPPHQNTVGHLSRRAQDGAGLTGIRLHDLRPFFASGLIGSGCDVVTVQRALGHAPATTTLNSYSHLWPDADDRTRAATESLMAASLEIPADNLRIV